VTRYVIDASAAVEYLLRTQLGQKIAEIIRDALLIAPALLDVEVLSVLRRAVLHKKLEEQRAALALEDLVAWQVDRIPHAELIWEAWRHRHNVSGYDSFYVAAAHLYKVPLLTADGPLSRAPILGVKVQNVRTAPYPP
jgi:predicted nucleic acid-binding protein